jgi:hypothetical protein
MKDHRRLPRLLFIAAIVLIALVLRLRAVDRLPIDNDEDDYLRAAQQYAAAINARDWAEFTRINYRPEHPPLVKIVYGVTLSPLPQVPEVPDRPTTASPPATLPQPHLTAARLMAAAFGVLEVLALALTDPLAGLFLAIHTFTIKYTSQVMLEAQPALTSLVAVLAYAKSRGRLNDRLALSAIALGLTAAAKYPYCIAGVAVAVDWVWSAHADTQPRHAAALKRRLAPLAGWVLLALGVFFAAAPYLWPDPSGRLRASLLYHGAYARSEAVRCHERLFWQPFGWLKKSVDWHPDVFVVSVDPLISVLALFGLRRMWRTRRVFALWLVFALGFLLAWPTKWPHYVLLLTAPLSLAAAEGSRSIWGWFAGRLHHAGECNNLSRPICVDRNKPIPPAPSQLHTL